MSDYTRYDAGQIRAWTKTVFEKLDVPPQDAAMATDTLIRADLMGIDSHGLARLNVLWHYAPGLIDGRVNARAVPEITHENASTAVIDGQGGLGPVASTIAMNLAIEKARQTGAGFVAVRNSLHYGASSHYATLALPHNMIGISMTIGGLGVVPTYGRGRRLGINPLSVAAPSKEEHPWILDMATSVVAGGKIELAKMRGQQVPIGWIIDKEGKPTTNPDDFWDGGALLPLGGAPETGGYKGYGLSVMIDILCGLLTGQGFSANLQSSGAIATTPHFQGALLIESFTSVDSFTTMMDDMIRTLRATEPAVGAQRVFVHGEKEWSSIQDRQANGIPYHRQVVGTLEELADNVGEPLPEPVSVN